MTGQNANGRVGIGDSSSYSGEIKAAITLGWTDETKDAMSVTADSYRGTVTLRNSFTDGETVYSPGRADNAALAGKTLVPSREIFSITVVDSIENGTVTAFPTSAAEDEIISLTVNPAEGYVLDTLTYTVGESEPVDVNENENGEYIFTMPAGSVTVTASFVPLTYTVTFDSDGGSEVAAQSLPTGGKAEKPNDPVREGYTFNGWYQVTGTDPEETLAETAFDFENTDITEDITLKAVWEELQAVIIKSANVEFQGVIRLQFKFIFPAEALADEGTYLTFEKAGTTTTKLVSEGTVSGEDVSFSIPVPAPEYADDITIKVYDGGDSQLTLKSSKGTDYTEDGFIYSVKTYAQKMSQNGSTEQMRRLAKALDDYCTAAQIYFKYGNYSSLSADSAVTAVALDDLAPYALTTSGTKPEGVTGASIMVQFESDNTLRITFKTDGSKPLSGYTFLLDSEETAPTVSGKNAWLQVVNIAAPNLDTPHTFTISDGTDTYTVTASALSYAYTSAKNGNPERQNLGKALYLYNQAANTRFGN